MVPLMRAEAWAGNQKILVMPGTYMVQPRALKVQSFSSVRSQANSPPSASGRRPFSDRSVAALAPTFTKVEEAEARKSRTGKFCSWVLPSWKLPALT